MTKWADDIRRLLTEFWLVWTSTEWNCDDTAFDWSAAFEYWIRRSQELHERLQQRRYWYIWYRLNGRRLPSCTFRQAQQDATWAETTIDVMDYARQLPLQKTYAARETMIEMAITMRYRPAISSTLLDYYNRRLWICMPPTLAQFECWNSADDKMDTISITYINGKLIDLDWIFG